MNLNFSLRKRFNSIARLKFSLLEEKKLERTLENIVEQESYNFYHNIYKNTLPLNLTEIGKTLHPTITAKNALKKFYDFIILNSPQNKKSIKKILIEYFSRKLITKKRIKQYELLTQQYTKFLYYNSSQTTILPLLEKLLEKELSEAELKASEINIAYYFFKKEIKKRLKQKKEKKLLKNFNDILENLTEKEITTLWINQYTQSQFIEWWIRYSKNSLILDFTIQYLKQNIEKEGKKHHWYDPRIDFEEEIQYLNPEDYLTEKNTSIEVITNDTFIVHSIILINSINKFYEHLYPEYKETFLYSYLELAQRIMEKKQQ